MCLVRPVVRPREKEGQGAGPQAGFSTRDTLLAFAGVQRVSHSKRSPLLAGYVPPPSRFTPLRPLFLFIDCMRLMTTPIPHLYQVNPKRIIRKPDGHIRQAHFSTIHVSPKCDPEFHKVIRSNLTYTLKVCVVTNCYGYLARPCTCSCVHLYTQGLPRVCCFQVNAVLVITLVGFSPVCV